MTICRNHLSHGKDCCCGWEHGPEFLKHVLCRGLKQHSNHRKIPVITVVLWHFMAYSPTEMSTKSVEEVLFSSNPPPISWFVFPIGALGWASPAVRLFCFHASLDAAGQRVFFCSQLHCIDHHGIYILPRKSSSTKVCLLRPILAWQQWAVTGSREDFGG